MTGRRPLALITGGLHRIGAAIAVMLAEDGWDLALHRRRNGEPDAELADAISRTGCAANIFSADLAESWAPQQLFDSVVEVCGRAPSLLVNNASLFGDGDWMAADSADLGAHQLVNLVAPVALARLTALASGLDASLDTCIINIVDQRVLNPVPDQFAYTLSKQALWQATRTMALAMAPHVRVNAVAPGLTLAGKDYAPGQMDRVAGMMPLRRLPEPSDIADAVRYLVGAKAVTGQTIFVDAGANLKSFERDFIAL